MHRASQWLHKYHRLTNYIGAASLYLKRNVLLKNELKQTDIKDRILGHWGTVPGINFLYGGLSYLAKTNNQEMMLIVGPGHGAPAILANSWLEGVLKDFYPQADLSEKGLEYVIKSFSWPKGFPSHIYPGIPGSILEGGELGYSLGVSFGAVFDNPNLLVPCIIGDGEAETGTLAASWHSNKFLNPSKDGMVLPILHLNGYKISNPTIYATMSNQELTQYFEGLFYTPYILDAYESNDIYSDYLSLLEKIYAHIKQIQLSWKEGDKVNLPMIIFRSKKGWTGPQECEGIIIEDNNIAHGIPLKHPKQNSNEFEALRTWLQGYNVNDLLNENGSPKKILYEFVPDYNLRLSNSRHAQREEIKKQLTLPECDKYKIEVLDRGFAEGSEMKRLSQYMVEVVDKNPDILRIFSPDESESNLLDPLFDVTTRMYSWPVRDQDKAFSPRGRVMEILSEQVLMSWMQGYNLTGRYGLLVSYEAFLSIITSQIDQYIKYLRQSMEFEWRKVVPSLNIIATSSVWRQDHNGFTHQNPILINSLLSKHVDFVNVLFPVDVNTMLTTMKSCFEETNTVNLIVSGKTDLPQWLSMSEAKEHTTKGISVWQWAGNESNDRPADIVLAAAGDYQTLEVLAGIKILNEICPELSVRFVNIHSLNCLGFGNKQYSCVTVEEINNIFGNDLPVYINFHGYPDAIKQLFFGTPISMRMKVRGYIEKGTTTTPFDMQVKNLTSRYHVALDAIHLVAHSIPSIKRRQSQLIFHLEDQINKHKAYILEHGDDMPHIKNWKWK